MSHRLDHDNHLTDFFKKNFLNSLSRSNSLKQNRFSLDSADSVVTQGSLRRYLSTLYIDNNMAPNMLQMLNRHLVVSLKVFYVGNISFQSNSLKVNFELILFPYISFKG